MKLSALSNLDIDAILRRQYPSFYRGTFSIDNVPYTNLLDDNKCIVVCNLSKQGFYGTHFVTLVYNEGTLLYLDSLARPVQEGFLTKFKPSVCYHLSEAIQPPHSEACGYYCIFFTLYFNRVMRGQSVDFIVPFSTSHTLRNDDICWKNIIMLQQAS